MTKTVFLFSILFTINCLASWDQCKSEVTKLITHPTDQFILVKNKNLIDQYGFANCDDLYTSLDTSIHEGVHFLDLSVASMPANPPPGFNFMDVFEGLFIDPSRRTAKSYINLDSPRDVIKRYSIRNQDKWSTSSNEFQRKYNLYISDPSKAASGSLLIGAATELNAYTHGLAAAQRVFENSGKPILGVAGERNGLLSFLIFFHVYIEQIQFENGSSWKALTEDTAAKSIISDLTTEAIKAIESSNICKTTYPQIDGPLLGDVKLFFNHETFKEIVGSTQSARLIEVLNCKNH